jgi:hypothetical protein
MRRVIAAILALAVLAVLLALIIAAHNNGYACIAVKGRPVCGGEVAP